MNKTMTSLLALGIGAAAYRIGKNNNLLSARTVRKMRRRIERAIF
ncbi:YrzQ family protein [Calidifontibacillus erzurumensis]|uniref:YrzQ family protein n=1 Tax=Calidifontibacillus erzurumensis TaxID=2741433 RepID=A0A8J8GAM3_9BACI|nr:YrzQ family protein [Calidifontibacillus erzurumensis]NSL50192.1 YrzQ family protein [Calidifontibacillus erzurumensis]